MLFAPLTKTLNTHNELTLRVKDWQNQDLDKQFKAIQEAPSQLNEALMKSNEALMHSNEAVEDPRKNQEL